MQNNNQDYHSMLPIGAELQMGKYRVERYLSSGGFGNTYVVRNVEFDEVFAMKEFFMKGVSERDQASATVSVSNPTNSEQFDQQRDKFKKEARRLRNLHNKHLVQVHDLFEENGTAYYIMDFVEGESLSARLKRTGQPLTERETLRVLNEVLEALDEVHAQKIWHLDLKPGNIMMDKNGSAILIDFGASKQMMDSGAYATTTGAMCYTPGYAPSEQIDQNIERIGPWTDLYALGATLYNLMTRKTPPSVSDIQDSEDVFQFPAYISGNMRKLVVWMMSPSRQRRPQSIAAVRNYLAKMPEAAFLQQVNADATVITGTGQQTGNPQTGQPVGGQGRPGVRPPGAGGSGVRPGGAGGPGVRPGGAGGPGVRPSGAGGPSVRPPQRPRVPGQGQPQAAGLAGSGAPRPRYIPPKKSGMPTWLKAVLIVGGILVILFVAFFAFLVFVAALDDSSYDDYDYSMYEEYVDTVETVEEAEWDDSVAYWDGTY